MSKMKRLGCLVLAIMFVFGIMLSGCGAPKEQTSASVTEGTGTGTGAAAVASKLDPVELNCYFLAPQCKDLQLVNDEVNKILKEKINATVKLNYFFWDSYQEKQKLLVASGETVDTMFSPLWWGFSNYVSQKALLPLDDLLAKYGKDITATINPAYLKAPRADGILYGIPTAKDMTGVGGVLLNKALVDKYKFDLSTIKNPEDFEPMLKVIKEKEPGIVPFLSIQGDHAAYFLADYYENIIQAEVPIGLKKEEGPPKVYNTEETPEFIKIIKMSNDWYKKGYINNDAATLKDGMPVKKAQKAFMWAEQLKPGKADEMKAQLGYEVVQVNAHADLRPFATTGDLTNSMLVISRTSKNPERAMMFLNLLFSDKKLKNLLSWGIEGKHYKKIGDNQIDFADGVTSETSGYTGVAQWAMGGDQFLDYLWASESPDKWKKMKEFNDSAIISKAVGWTYNQQAVKTEIAALATVGTQYGKPLASGIVDYDAFYPKMKKDLTQAGIDKVIADAQKQVDAFLAGNK